MASNDIKCGQLISHRYRIEKALGATKPGNTFLCTDLRDGQSRVIMKTFSFSSSGDKDLSVLRQRFSTLGRVRHPELARYLDFGMFEKDQRSFLIREFVEGSDIFTASEGWNVERIVQMVVKVCRILHHLHSERIFHGSLRPFNVICNESDDESFVIRVLDYCLDLSTQERMRAGVHQLAYCAPEVLLGKTSGVSSDLYALGVLAYQLLTRRLPFEQDDQGYIVQKHLQGRADMRAVECLEGGQGLAQVLRDLLEKDPARRPSSASEVVRLLSAAMGRDYSGVVRGPLECCFSQSRFVGREREMSFLQERAASVLESKRGWSVFILGEAGSGKTRCMEEFRIWALLNGWRIVEGRCLPQESRSYHPYRQVLESTVSRVAESGDLLEPRPDFQFVADPSLFEAGARQVLTDYEANQFRDLLAREVLGRLTSCPTLLFLHDFHWADDAIATVLEYLISDISAHPIMICVSLRPSEEPKSSVGRLMEVSARRLRMETLALSALSESSIDDLIASMTGDAGLAKRIGPWVHKYCGGNPFFAEEILKHFVDRNLLRKDPDGWIFERDAFEKVEVPDSIAVILRHRLDSLSESAREVAEWLAVFHRAVSVDLLKSAVSVGEAKMAESIEELSASQIIRQATGEEGDCIDFQHALIGEVIREALPKAQLRRMHRKIGETIEEQLGPEKCFLELAKHYTEGRCGEKAVKFALKAAAAYRAEFANETAVNYYEYALRDKNSLPSETKLEIAADVAEIYCSLGRARQAVRIVTSLKAQEKKPLPEIIHARILTQLASAYQHLGDRQGVECTARRGLQILMGNDSVQARSSKALFLKLLSYNAAVESDFKKGLGLLRAALKFLSPKERFLSGLIFASISGIQWIGCNLREALAASVRSIDLLDSPQTRNLQATAYSLNAIALHALGRFQLALKSHAQAASLSESTRSLVVRAQALGNFAECLCRSGATGESLEMVVQALRLSDASDNEAVRSGIESVGAEIKILQGEYKSATHVLERLKTEGKATLAVYSTAHVLFLSAWVAVETADYRAAIELLDELNQISRNVPTYVSELGEVLRARTVSYLESPQSALKLLLQLDRVLAGKRWAYHHCILKVEIADVALRLGDLMLSRKAARDALRLSRAMPSRRLEAHSQYLLTRAVLNELESRVCLGSDPVDSGQSLIKERIKARDQLTNAVHTAQAADAKELLWRLFAELGRLEESLSSNEASLSYCRRSLKCMDALESNVPTSSLQAYRDCPERRTIRRECQERIRRLETSLRNHSLQLERIEQEHLRLLFHASVLINGKRDLTQLEEVISKQLLTIAGMDRSCLFLIDEVSCRLRMIREELSDAGLNMRAMPPDRELVDEVFQTGRPFVSADCSSDARLRRRTGNDDSRSGAVLCAPLLAGGRAIGVLYADKLTSIEKPGDSTINLFAAFSNLSAVALDNAMAHQYLLKEKTELQEHLRQTSEGYPEIVGNSSAIAKLRERIALVAASPLDVLIMGESGTGKELVARALQRTGRRSRGPFIPLDCGALSDSLIESELFGYRKGAFTGAAENKAGILEAASGGVVFLDEISNLSTKLQGKLLRVLQEREVRRIGETQHRRIDIQIIAATNHNLLEEIRKGRFRKDLYYRLNAMQVFLVPLREHFEDIPILVDWFLRKTIQMEDGKVKAFSHQALTFLSAFPFPGNVRELRNIVQSSYYNCPGNLIEMGHLPSEIQSEAAEQPLGGHEVTGRQIFDRIREGKGTFDLLVKEPFLERTFGRNTVRQVLRLALRETGGRYRDAFRLLKIPSAQYASMMIFLKRHFCYLDFRPFRQSKNAGA